MKPARLLCPWDSPGQNTRVSCHALLQEIFPTQGSNPGLLHCRWVPYHLSHPRKLVLYTLFFLVFFNVDHLKKSLLNLLKFCFCFMFWFFVCEAWGILAPPPGIEPAFCPLAGKVLTTGLPGKYLYHPFFLQGMGFWFVYLCFLMYKCIQFLSKNSLTILLLLLSLSHCM